VGSVGCSGCPGGICRHHVDFIVCAQFALALIERAATSSLCSSPEAALSRAQLIPEVKPKRAKTSTSYKWAQSLGIDCGQILTRTGMLGAFSPEAFGRSERVNLMLLSPLPLIAVAWFC
jgi:hypothetical protein